MPSPPNPQPPQNGYFGPPPGVVEMYAPPQLQQNAPTYVELPGSEISGIQQGQGQAYGRPNDLKPAMQQHAYGHGLGIPQIAELPG